jgi:hypothetical protein
MDNAGFLVLMGISLERSAVQLTSSPVFQKDISPSPLESKSKPRNKPAETGGKLSLLHTGISFSLIHQT